MSPDEAQRLRNVVIPASEPQVNEPAAPPVERMYFTPALWRRPTFAVAIAAPGTPPQFSLPHSPVAKASVTVLPPLAARSAAMPAREPDSIVEATLVFQSMLMLVSL